MKFALIGNGFIAPKHIEAIKAIGGELVAVCDIDPKKEIKGIPFFTDYKEAIKLADCVSICTPNYLHKEMILECVAWGKMVLCEKPMSFNLGDFGLLNELPNVYGNFQLRYLPEIGEMRAKAKNSQSVVLKVQMKRSKTYYDSWKGDSTKTGGLLMNIGCHYFDLLGHLFGYRGFVSQIEELSDLRANGTLFYPTTTINWVVEFTEEQNEYERSLTIDGQRFDLVQKSNLHLRTYEDFAWGHGIRPEQEEKIVKMIYAI